MKPLAALLSMSVMLSGHAAAADYSKVMWAYATGQSRVTPAMDSRLMGEVVMQIWVKPPGVPVEGLMFLYMPKRSQAHWALMAVNPTAPARELFGAKTVTSLGRQADLKRPELVWNVYRLEDGTFKSLYYMDGTGVEKSGKRVRVVMLLTPQVMEGRLSPSDFLK